MRVWVDIDNAPHVAFFRPVIADLRASGAEVLVTARGRTFVPELLAAAGIEHEIIGRGQPRGFVGKAGALLGRAAALAWWARGRRLDVAIGHGSRSLPIAAKSLGVPNLTTYDYEHVDSRIFDRFCDRIVVPRVVYQALGEIRPNRFYYNGFKEEIYLEAYVPNREVLKELGVAADTVLVVVRPPARAAHYHDARSEAIEQAILDRLSTSGATTLIWLRRDPGDPVPTGPHIVAPDRPLDGISVVAAADLVVSGGGTMIREAALLGTPAYSVFTGPTGAVDAELGRRGWLTMIRDPQDVAAIRIERKASASRPRLRPSVRAELIAHIVDTARRRAASSREVSWESPSSI